MRLFIAIRLSDEMKKALINCMHDLKKQGVEETMFRRKICI